MLKKLFIARNENTTLILRLILGLTMFLHGAQKALGWFGGYGWSNTVAFFGKMGMPGFIAHLVILGEFVGGFLLIVGLLTRFAAASNGIIMAGAVFMVHWSGGFFAQSKGFEYPLVLLVICIYYVVASSEKLSLDAKIFGTKS